MKKKKPIKLSKILIYVIIIIGAFTMIVPFVWMILTAFKSQTEATQMNPFVIIPSVWRTDGFKSVLSKMNFLNLYKNTFVLIVARLICTILTATTAGYAFARLNFRGRNLAFSLVLLQMMIPSQIFIIPQYLMISKLGMLNTHFALLFPGLVSAFGTFFMRQAFKTLPKELEEAARLDGCNIGQTFLFIMAPLTKSSMSALGIFTALFAYKELMWPLVVNTEQNTMPISAGLAKLQGQFTSNYPELMAASLLASVPMIVLYILFQKQIVEGIATTGGKL